MVLRHVSILRDHPQGYACTLLKSLNYLKDFKNYKWVKHQHMPFLLNTILVPRVHFIKIHKIFNGTPTCFDLKRSSSGICLYLAKVTELFKRF